MLIWMNEWMSSLAEINKNENKNISVLPITECSYISRRILYETILLLEQNEQE